MLFYATSNNLTLFWLDYLPIFLCDSFKNWSQYTKAYPFTITDGKTL